MMAIYLQLASAVEAQVAKKLWLLMTSFKSLKVSWEPSGDRRPIIGT
jgi:hypothetical protein